MITRFSVRNYKALKDVTLNLTPMHLLIGPNDSGKTSLLEAMSAICRSVDMPLQKVFPGTWEGTEFISDGVSDPNLSLELEGQTSKTFRYLVDIRFPVARRDVRITNEEIEIEGRRSALKDAYARGPNETTLHRQIGQNDKDAVSRLQGEITSTDLIELYHAIFPVHLYQWNARLLATPSALEAENPFRINASGFGLARVLDDILGYDRERFSALERRFTHFFPTVGSIRLKSTSAYTATGSPDELVPELRTATGKGIYVRFHGHDTDIPARQLSEGMILVLGYLAVLYSPQPPRLLLIEEPENGIHPSRLKEIIRMLRELIQEHPETQVVLTTHSPYLVDQFSPEEVTLCHKGPDGHIRTRRLSESSVVQQQQNIFSLGEIWPAEEEAIVQEMEGLIVETGQPS